MAGRLLAQLRRFWFAYIDALERYLDRLNQSTPSKREKGEDK